MRGSFLAKAIFLLSSDFCHVIRERAFKSFFYINFFLLAVTGSASGQKKEIGGAASQESQFSRDGKLPAVTKSLLSVVILILRARYRITREQKCLIKELFFLNFNIILFFIVPLWLRALIKLGRFLGDFFFNSLVKQRDLFQDCDLFRCSV